MATLRRSRTNRWIGGVCGGLAEYFGLNAAVYRVLFIALAFAGGTGVLLYLAAVLVMPNEGSDEAILSETLRRHRDRPWLVIGLALLALCLISAVSGSHVGPGDGDALFWPGAPLFWLVLGGLVLAIVWGVRGGWRRLALTIAVIVLAFVAVASAAIAFAEAHGGFRDVTEQPVLASDLPRQYELGAGEVNLDLRRLQLPPGETRVGVDIAFGGSIDVTLPDDVPVSAHGKVGWGDASILGFEGDGHDVERRVVERGFGDADRRLVIDAHLGAGELDIHR